MTESSIKLSSKDIIFIAEKRLVFQEFLQDLKEAEFKILNKLYNKETYYVDYMLNKRQSSILNRLIDLLDLILINGRSYVEIPHYIDRCVENYEHIINEGTYCELSYLIITEIKKFKN